VANFADLLAARAADQHDAIRFRESRDEPTRTWSWADYVVECRARAALLEDLRVDDVPFHVGVLLDNVPEFPMWLGGAALAGATLVGINPTRRGEELARDIRHTDCQLIVTEPVHRPTLDGLDLGLDADRVLDVESDAYAMVVAEHRGAPSVAPDVDDGSQFLLLFTSGTTGAPKAVICSQGRLARAGLGLTANFGLSTDDVAYLSMPLFHSNALFAGWSPAIVAGMTMALRRRFSASGVLEDVRDLGCTYMNYVGKPLAYVLATPEQADDADNPLRVVFGNEAAEPDTKRFAERFGVIVVDGYGSTEGGAVVNRDPAQPPGSLGHAGDTIEVRDPDTGERCPPARFDDDGVLLNPEEAIGEMVSTVGLASFEGYWNNDEANRERARDGVYWTGDLAYVDEAGYVFFAGRGFEWLRVDGENFAAAPVERILARHPDVGEVAVYAVPDEVVGDQVMAAVVPTAGGFDGATLHAFLDEQADLGTKWAPRYVRVVDVLPATTTNKVLKRQLRTEGWDVDDEVWWRPERSGPYAVMSGADADALRARFAAR
jgi:fatty-acyl-CoA synthase